MRFGKVNRYITEAVLLLYLLHPIVILPCVYFRQNGFSLIYLMFFFIGIWLPAPTSRRNMKGVTGLVLKTECMLCTAIICSQIFFIIASLSSRDIDSALIFCGNLEQVLREVGLVNLKNLHFDLILLAVIPEFIMSMLILTVYKRCTYLAVKKLKYYDIEGGERRIFVSLVRVAPYIVVVTLCFTGVVWPSALSSICFFAFLGCTTLWSLKKNNSNISIAFLFIVLIALILHSVALFVVQMQWPQEHIRVYSNYLRKVKFSIIFSRYLGLAVITTIECSDPRIPHYAPLKWNIYIGSLMYLIEYQIISGYLKILIQDKKYGPRRGTRSRKSFLAFREMSHHKGKDLKLGAKYIFEGIEIFFNTLWLMDNRDEFLFILTCTTMLIWSVAYPSWLGLVWLIWAAVMGVLPRMHNVIAKVAPFTIFYAECLLIKEYLYSLDLTEEELPQEINGVDLREVGFYRSDSFHLLIKCLFTVPFWILVRCYSSRKLQELNKATILNEGNYLPRFLECCYFVRITAVKWWISITSLLVLITSLLGERVAMCHIVFMVLFLFFVIIYQFSYDNWRNILYLYWLTVAVFSLLLLIIDYTYQFSHVEDFWESAGITKNIQHVLGFEKRKAITPFYVSLICLIIAIFIQLQLIEDFLTMTAIQNRPQEPRVDAKKTKKSLQRFYQVRDFVFLYLEAHLPKLVSIVICLLCLLHVSVLHYGILFMGIGLMIIGHTYRIYLTRFCILTVCGLILSLMIYQLSVFYEEPYDTYCLKDVTTNFSETPKPTNIKGNTLKWIGLQKVDNFAYQIRSHLTYLMIMIIARAIVIYNKSRRRSPDRFRRHAYLIFPNIRRHEADTSTKQCIQFLINYGFYMFGIEVCFIMMVLVIALRMDMYAALYAMWLFGLFSLQRHTLSKVWNYLCGFVILSIAVQYAVLLGLPPTYCIGYPWFTDEFWRRFQDWSFLPDPIFSPSYRRIIPEIILLLLLCRQRVVFIIEKKYGIFISGRRKSNIFAEIETPNFIIPVPDFVTYTRSWLDIFKRIVFMGLFWITSFLVALTGTIHISLFSAIYLISAFTFLWQGSEFYLLPWRKIIFQWNLLLAYNILVITCKTLFQLLSCVFVKPTERNACLFFQLFAVQCAYVIPSTSEQTNVSGINRSICVTEQSDFYIFFDVISFIFIIATRHVLRSYYFVHLINDAKAGALLASRGAELLEAIRIKRIAAQGERERKILGGIRDKMEEFKAKRNEKQGGYQSPPLHSDAVRAGDYYMFEEEIVEKLENLEEEEDEDEKKDEDIDISDTFSEKSTEYEDDDEEKIYKRTSHRMTLGKLISATIRLDMKKAVEKAFQSAQTDLPQQGKSKDELEEEDEKIKEMEGGSNDSDEEHSHRSRRSIFFAWLWAFADSLLWSATLIFNNLTKDHRRIMRTLTREKLILMGTSSELKGVRTRSIMFWEIRRDLSLMEERASIDAQRYSHVSEGLLSQESLKEINPRRDEVKFMKRTYRSTCASFLLAFYFLLVAYSDVLCYIAIIIKQIIEPSLLSFVMISLVFVWGTLSIPRPAKTFWVIMLTYIETIVAVKTLLLIRYMPWHHTYTEEPLTPWKVIGIEHHKALYALGDLLILLFIFFHRFRLRRYGLWEHASGGHILKETTRAQRGNSWDAEYSISSTSLSPDSSSDSIDAEFKGLDIQSPLLRPTRRHEARDIDVTRVVEKRTDYFPRILVISAFKYFNSVNEFYSVLLFSPSRVNVDVYTCMFTFDVFCFLLMIFGIQAFGRLNENLIWYFKQNRIPILVAILIFFNFLYIVIDRFIYVSRNVLAKLVFQYIIIIQLHGLLFFYLPSYNYRAFNKSPILQIYYFFKCIYLLISAHQIRCGYELYEYGYFLRKKFGVFHWMVHIAFRLLPFFAELRCLIDWCGTATTLTLLEWFRMEDIYFINYDVKCARVYDLNHKKLRGVQRPLLTKIVLGGSLLVILVIILLLPIFLYFFVNLFGKPNIPFSIEVSVSLGTYSPIYRSPNFAQQIFTESTWEEFNRIYERNTKALESLDYHKENSFVAFTLPTVSSTDWDLPDSTKELLINDLEEHGIFVVMDWELKYENTRLKQQGLNKYNFKPDILIRQQLIQQIRSGTSVSIDIPFIMPKFLTPLITMEKVSDYVKPLSRFMTAEDYEDDTFRNITLKFDGTRWEIQEVCAGHNWEMFLKNIPYNNCEHIVIYMFCEKAAGVLQSITSIGLQGIYFFLLVGLNKVVRLLIRNSTYKIMFREVPSPDRILCLCHEVYKVRVAKEFDLEEDLFAKLVFLYRSPATLIEYTRPRKQEKKNE